MYDNQNSIKDGYPQFEEGIKRFFDKAISGGKKLFTTNVEDLYELYLANLPEENGTRQHYTCHGCEHFINRFGGLVVLDDNGIMKSAVWDETNTPSFFLPAVKMMKEAVLDSRINGVFVPDARVLGTPRTGEWSHLSLPLPHGMVNKSIIKNAYQVMAEKRESYGVLSRSLDDFTLEHAQKAVTLLESETVYRSDTIMAPAKFFRDLVSHIQSVSNPIQKSNLIWAAVAQYPQGLTHIRSAKVGTVLQDIKDGMDLALVASRFKTIMNPATHMRSQSAPSANAKHEAEKVIQKLTEAGIASAESLERRYASIEEIPSFIWKNYGLAKAAEVKPSGIFGHVPTKEKAVGTDKTTVPGTVMTWEKFQRTIIPTAENIEVLVDNPNRFMGLITAVHPSAPNILLWDNLFSWYYPTGVDAEIRRRVEGAGGRYEDNEIRCSLIWESYSDLDIHCVTPRGEHVYFNSKKDKFGGYLDIDMNAGGRQTNKPVENIRWAKNAPEGRYRFYVHNFADRNGNENPYRVELEVNGQVFTVQGTARGTGFQEDAFVFDYVKDQAPRIVSQGHSAGSAWGLTSGDFVKVTGIVPSPNLWGDNPVPHSGTHVFFLLDGAQDATEGKGRGFFNEMLKPELREIRRVLEFYTASTPIQGADKATACGVGYSKDNEWNLTLKVTSKDSTRIIKIDRWD